MAIHVVTGGAGFIGSHIVRALVSTGHGVRIVDDFSNGRRLNLADIEHRIDWIEACITNTDVLTEVLAGCDCCFHLAALGSVARSIKNPTRSNEVNVEGSLSVLTAAREAQVRRVICASSSSVYGNQMAQGAAVESLPRAPISPYAVSKAAAEMYAEVFAATFGMDVVCLRYFNVFGPRQNPEAEYAAVIPLFIKQLMSGRAPVVFGDGRQSRDFSYVENVVSANLLACEAPGRIAGVYNIACGQSTSILQILETLNALLGTRYTPMFAPRRAGDIHCSLANTDKARQTFGYHPLVDVGEGLARTVEWHLALQKAA